MTPLVSALLIKLTLILSLGLAVAATLRAFSPSFRHLVLYATLASGAALPLVMWISPQWNVGVLPRSIAGANALTIETEARPSNKALTTQVMNTGAPRSPSGTLTQSAAGQIPSAVRDVFAAIPLLPLAWAIGFVAVIAWLAIGRLGLRRIAATAWPLNTADWQAILDEERNYARVTKPVLLSSSSVVSTPLTWGTRAPVILLPEESLDWPEAHRRIVLRHELAHIARGDSLTQLVAGFICALYWFHPLVWITERRLRAECERACDDNVVSLGTPAAEYAAHLLEVARSEERRVGKECLAVCRSRWSPYH